MINHTDQYNRIEKTFRELQKEYEIFRKNPTYRNRLLIQNKIKEHRQSLTKNQVKRKLKEEEKNVK